MRTIVILCLFPVFLVLSGACAGRQRPAPYGTGQSHSSGMRPEMRQPAPTAAPDPKVQSDPVDMSIGSIEAPATPVEIESGVPAPTAAPAAVERTGSTQDRPVPKKSATPRPSAASGVAHTAPAASSAPPAPAIIVIADAPAQAAAASLQDISTPLASADRPLRVLEPGALKPEPSLFRRIYLPVILFVGILGVLLGALLSLHPPRPSSFDDDVIPDTVPGLTAHAVIIRASAPVAPSLAPSPVQEAPPPVPDLFASGTGSVPTSLDDAFDHEESTASDHPPDFPEAMASIIVDPSLN